MKKILLLLLLTGIFACEQEQLTDKNCIAPHTVPAVNVDTIIPVWECFDPADFITPPSVFYLERYQFYAPSFNPNDSTQIAYRLWDRNLQESSAWVFDFCTGASTFLAKCRPNSTVDWSVKNWIVYTGRDTNLWKIKPNGTEATQLTSLEGEFTYTIWAVWDNQGERILYRRSPDHYLIISDENGNDLDSIPELGISFQWDWMGNDAILSTLARDDPQHGIGYFDLNTREYHNIDQTNFGTSYLDRIRDLIWLEEEQSILWQTHTLIAKTNIHTLQRTVVKEGFPNARQYSGFGLSPDKEGFIVHRFDWEYANICSVFVRNHLYLMNMDGSYERRILLDW